MSEIKKNSSSTANHPDLDWSQVKETVLMLKLAAAQVEFSLKDGSNSVNTLTDSFTSMAGSIKAIELGTSGLFEKYNVDESDQQIVVDNCQQVSSKMQQAIVAFQFYDTLVQRMDHVVNSLSKLGDLVSDPARLYSPHEWGALQEVIRSRYTMEKERVLFDAILNGEDMMEVLEKMHQVATTEDEIELF
ncbi:MAG: hypothetical protein DIZ80_15865 [endosymbiont of Galathealinum brachiosum]|uniref:Chemotaxis protein n=1 Tax=endosymbiont of Galathealinum brachiosum TaxID=2200906 RepID=A0A370D9G7_9GAMM|nr:MAG: hypothetical protein DIZ80_15865 [endosymbiont of Galathealinum brachiosum]